MKARIFKNCTVEIFYEEDIFDPEFITVHTPDTDYQKDFDIEARQRVFRLKINPDDKEEFLKEDDEK